MFIHYTYVGYQLFSFKTLYLLKRDNLNISRSAYMVIFSAKF